MHEQFNNLAIDFLEKMEVSFPQEPKIKVYKQKYEMIQFMNSKKPIELFMENMYDFGEKILSRDESFFKQDQFVNKAQSISGKMGLVKYWDTMNTSTQDSIWQYVQGLYILGMGALGHTEELKKMIEKTGFQG